MTNYWRDYTDLYRTKELTEICFKDSLRDKLQKWNSNANNESWVKRNDRVCYKQIKHARYFGNQINQLLTDINNTRNLFKLHVELNKDSFDFEAGEIKHMATEQESLAVFLNYQNQKFDLQMYAGAKNDITFDLGWLMEKIFVLKPATLARAEQLITALECLKLDQRFVRTPDHSEKDEFSQDYVWNAKYSENFIEKVMKIVEERDLAAVYFYLSLVFRGIVNSKIDNYTYTKKKLQMWRLSPNTRFSFEFTECLSTKKLYQSNKWLSFYVCGRVLPVRLPIVKVEEGSDSENLQTELVSFQYTQFIYLDDIKAFEDEENFEEVNLDANTQNRALSYFEQKALDERKKLKDGSKVVKIKTIKRHLFKTWDQLGAPLDLPEPQTMDVFLFSKMEEFKNFANSVYGTLKEACTVEAFKSRRLPTMRLLNQQMEKVKFITKDIQNFKFDHQTRTWKLPQSMEPEKIEVISSHIDNREEFQNETLIIRKLTQEQNTTKLLQILEQIPNLDLQLNSLQKAVVISTKDLLCLGRSGTGKTTSSVLRLFSQEIMFLSLRKVAALQKTKEISGITHKLTLTSEDLKQPCAMKTVFLSASPVLINEVSRFYKRLKDSLITHLEKKEQSGLNNSEISLEKSEIDIVRKQHEELIQLAQIEADEIDQEIASEQQFEIPNAFEDLRPRHFPLFATVKQLLYMLDASLANSFFCRDGKNNLIGMSSNLSWHNENKGMFMINSEYKNVADYDALLAKYGNELLEEQDLPVALGAAVEEKQQQEENLKVQKGWYQRYRTTDQIQTRGASWLYSNQQLSFEVDYDIFVQKFYKRFKSKNSNLQKHNKLSETMIWTEIFSVIKGGLNSGDHYQGFLTGKNYISKYASPFLSDMERKTVYWIFLEYEKWKKQENAFDLMDLVHHINTSGKTNQRYYNEIRINYLMIDEVQDLTPKTLQLLLKITNERVFFAGDTAQTIAKGVSARFSDLSTLLKTFGTKVIQLTTNYRSHGQILALANSVVGLIETLFPFSIDKLEKEESLTTGMKPLIIMPLPDHELRSIFIGRNHVQSTEATTGLSSQKPQFGCNQVVIVRDQDQKDKVPEFLKAMLCLTVYEVKGLEFDDVILYNFFCQGEVEQMHWKLLNDVSIETKTGEDGINFDQIVDGLESLLNDEQNEELNQFLDINKRQKKLKSRQVMINTSTKNRSLVYRKYALLCIELKQLYVAITRPKKRLIIYDDDAKTRIPIQRVWESLGVVNTVSSTMIEQDQLPEEIKDLFMGNSSSGCLGYDTSKPEDWKVQGIKFYKKKQFDQAVKCFTYADEHDLVVKCTAYQLADAGNNKLSEAESIMWRIKNVTSILKQERKALTKKAQQLRVVARKDFGRAGESFEQVGLKSQAASCYFTAKSYSQAAIVFEQLHQFAQAGECLMLAHKDSTAILRAAEMFERGNLTTRAIECYERIGAWERLLQCIHTQRGAFKKSERESLANKYIPIALNKLYLLLTGEEKIDEKNQGALAELKIKAKYAKQVSEQIIEEEEEQMYDSELDESDDSEALKIPKEPVESESIQAEDQKVEKFENSDENLIEDDEAGLEVFKEVFQLKKNKSKESEQPEPEVVQADNLSYELISEGGSDQAGSEKAANNKIVIGSDFEHLSQYDPDDEFLQSSHSFSLLQSILSNRDVEQTSEFSIIQDEDSFSMISGSSYGGSIRMINSQKKIEDAIIRKIIFYISLFSDEIKQKLNKLGKSNKATDSVCVDGEDQIDLTKIQNDFLETILNILEHYDLIKLCLIICNKFKLTSKLGRYAVTSCLKYQSLQQVRFTASYDSLRPETIEYQRLKQQSMIAHEAIHNVFGLIAPKYLTLKRYDEQLNQQNSLGMDNYRLIFALGFWKKLVYTMNVTISLNLCYKFADSYNFNILLDHLSDQTQLSKTHITQSKLIYLRQVAIVIQKHVIRNKQKSLDLANRHQSMIRNIEEELTFSQLTEKPFVQDLLSLVSYLVIPELKHTKAEVVVGNKIQNKDDKIEREKTLANYEKTWNKTLALAQDVVKKMFEYEAIDTESQMIQGLFAFQLAAYGATNQKLNRLVKDTSSLKILLDLFKCASQSLKSQQNLGLQKEVLLMSYNIISLGSDDFSSDISSDQTDSLFKQFEQTHYLVSFNSPIINSIQRIQKLKLQTAHQKQYMLIGEKICLQEYKKQSRTDRIQRLTKELEKNVDKFEIEQFKSQVLTNRSHLATLIDMDLQFLLVPKDWVDKIILPNVTLIPAYITEIIEKNTIQQIKAQQNDDDEFKQKQIFILSCFNYSYKSGLLTIQSDVEQSRRLNMSQFEDYDELHRIYSGLNLKTQTQLFQNYKMIKSITGNRAAEFAQKFVNISISKDIKRHKLFQLINLIENQNLNFGFLKVASLVNENNLEAQSRIVLCETGLTFLQEAINFSDKPDWSKEIDIVIERFYRFLKHSLQFFSMARNQSVFIDCVGLLLKNSNLPKSLRNILKGFRHQAYSDADFQASRTLPAIQNSIRFYQKIAPYLPVADNCEILTAAFYRTFILLQTQTFIPIDALKYLDVKFDCVSLLLAAENEERELQGPSGDYDQVSIEDVDEEQYYDEWDRPDMSTIKQLQLSKRPSQQPVKLHKVIEYKSELNLPANTPKTAALTNQLLGLLLELIKLINSDEFSAHAVKQIFNIVICVCVNSTKVDLFIDVIRQSFEQFEKSALSDHFHDLLFQYTDNPYDLRQMFDETDDYSKYQFFTGDVHLVAMTFKQVQKEDNNVQINFGLEKELIKRFQARQTIKKCMQVISGKSRAFLRKDLSIKLKAIGADTHILSVESELPQLPVLLSLINLISQRLQTIQSYYTSSQTQVSCFDVQVILARQNDYEQVKMKIVGQIKSFVKSKYEILQEYANVGEADQELRIAVEEAKDSITRLDSQLQIWNMLSTYNKNLNQMEDEVSRAQRMKIKWQSWNTLTMRKLRLEQKLKKLQAK